MAKQLFILFWIALFIPAIVTAQSNSTPEVKIKKKNLSINNIPITPDWLLNDAKSALGSPDRVRDGYNITHTYDKIGIVLFELSSNKKGSGNISELQVHFYVSEPNEVTPKGTYQSIVKIDKLKASRSTDKETMLKKLSNWEKTDSYMEHSYRMSNGSIYIYFQFSKDEQMLEKISIGKNKK